LSASTGVKGGNNRLDENWGEGVVSKLVAGLAVEHHLEDAHLNVVDAFEALS
jgi:hypothetical protein